MSHRLNPMRTWRGIKIRQVGRFLLRLSLVISSARFFIVFERQFVHGKYDVVRTRLLAIRCLS